MQIQIDEGRKRIILKSSYPLKAEEVMKAVHKLGKAFAQYTLKLKNEADGDDK